jgi:hypothetical protein
MTYSEVKALARTVPALRWLKRGVDRIAGAALRPGEHIAWQFHRRWVRHRILETRPVPLAEERSVELHMLTCGRDLLEALWTLKSFFHYSELRPQVVIHDDGSLDAEAQILLERHVPGVRIETRADADARIAPLLQRYPHCRRYRLGTGHVLSLKLFDPFLLSSAEQILLLDSDVLFFDQPVDLEQHVQIGTGCYQRDYQDSYITSRQDLEAWSSAPIPLQLNSGILHLPRRVFDLEVLDAYCRYAFALEGEDTRLQRWGEQTAYAVLVAHHPAGCHALPRRYQISRGGARAEAVCGHFVSDDYRHLLYASGMSRLRKAGLLGATACTP